MNTIIFLMLLSSVCMLMGWELIGIWQMLIAILITIDRKNPKR